MVHGRLEEEPTVAGYLARRCEVQGRCYRRDCRRWCVFDFELLIAGGMGLLKVREVQRTFYCNRIGGCGLIFEEKPERPIGLGELAGRDHVGVEIRCRGCGKITVTSVEAMIAKLEATKLGGPLTDIKKLAELIRGPCGKCKAKAWAVEILWCQPGGKVPLWKAELERRRDAARSARWNAEPGP